MNGPLVRFDVVVADDDFVCGDPRHLTSDSSAICYG
jgi:hypothetical protein